MGALFIVLVALGFIVVGIIAWGAGIYNSLVALRNNIDKSWANIDVILKQRLDELSKLVDTCKGYIQHEKTVLENITKARTQFLNAPTTQEKTAAENQISSGLKTLFAVAENYPDLKANQNFLNIQSRVSVLEESIADRRELFNDTVTIFNTKIQSFPDMFVAGFLRYEKHPLLEIPKAETADIKIQF